MPFHDKIAELSRYNAVSPADCNTPISASYATCLVCTSHLRNCAWRSAVDRNNKNAVRISIQICSCVIATERRPCHHKYAVFVIADCPNKVAVTSSVIMNSFFFALISDVRLCL